MEIIKVKGHWRFIEIIQVKGHWRLIEILKVKGRSLEVNGDYKGQK